MPRLHTGGGGQGDIYRVRLPVRRYAREGWGDGVSVGCGGRVTSKLRFRYSVDGK